MKARLCVLAALAASLSPAAASAQERELREARAAFARGLEAYEAGEFETALREFERADEAVDSPDLMYDIALTHDALGHAHGALAAFEAYLIERPEERARLEERLARLTEAAGGSPRDPVAIVAAVPPLALPAPAAPRRSSSADAALALPAATEPPATGGSAAPWALVGAGSAAVLGGVGLLVAARFDAASVTEATRWTDARGAADRALAFDVAGLVGLGVGALAIAGGVLVWALDDATTAELSLGPTSARARISF